MYLHVDRRQLPYKHTVHMTSRQKTIFEFIRDCINVRGWAPSFVEIQAKFDFKSPATVTDHLKALERHGLITRGTGAREIALSSARETRSIPIFGTIPAGPPSYEQQGDEGTIAVDVNALKLPKGDKIYALKVKGDSMIGDGILDGDVVILEYRGSANNGEIVAAYVDGQTTLKRYLVKGRKVVLRASNPKYPDIVPTQELMIQGTMIGLWRTR